MKSLDLAAPYLGQFHLRNTIVDPKEPCFGDLDMDVARAREWKTEGFFNTGGWSRNLKEGSMVRLPAGMEQVYVAVEVLGHPGDDLWLKEEKRKSIFKEML
ncbi:MAG: hypothetical protein V8S96_02200 [Lachnospiraceae bacterium]